MDTERKKNNVGKKMVGRSDDLCFVFGGGAILFMSIFICLSLQNGDANNSVFTHNNNLIFP